MLKIEQKNLLQKKKFLNRFSSVWWETNLVHHFKIVKDNLRIQQKRTYL